MGENIRKRCKRSLKMPGRTVVIVEDVATCATTLELAFLAIRDVTVVVLPTAQEALRLLENHDCAVRAVVTDLNMPRMDGFEFIERIRTQSRHRRLPIIVVSGDTDPRTPQRVSALGADAFFSKPYSPAEVRLKLEQFLDANSADCSP
jgi:two-component system chemotaxis response regulator CheY